MSYLAPPPAFDPTDDITVLRTGQLVSRKLYDRVLKHVSRAIPMAQQYPKATFTTEHLCGPGLWFDLSMLQRRHAGSCIADMVKTGHLALVQSTPDKTYPRRYRAK